MPPCEVLKVIEEVGDSWCAKLVWDYLAVPKNSHQFGIRPTYDRRFFSILMEWSYGRNIHVDQVAFERPGRKLTGSPDHFG